MANAKTGAGVLVAVALLIAAGVAWYLVSPAWTLREMKAAADSNDPDTLNSYIDYPALRESLKEEISTQMIADARRRHASLASLGMVIGTAMVGPAVDALVTPSAVRTALIARPEADPAASEPTAASALRVPDSPLIIRRGLSEFLVTRKRQAKSALIFKRHGLSWKLSGVDLGPFAIAPGKRP